MYKVFYWRTKQGINTAYKIFKANSIEDAMIKADVDPELIYGVYDLDEWMKFCEDRRGIYNKELLIKIEN